MRFLKHIGKHGDRKVAVVFREVPNEPHMCLVVYTELLNRNIHDPVMQCIESDIGQSSESLSDALNRSFTKDGRPLLQVLHVEQQLKKVQTEQILMTPMTGTTIRLNELNKILDEMQQGEEAVKKLQEMDKSRGMQTPAEVARRMRETSPVQSQPQDVSPSTIGALDDRTLARQRMSQAMKMENEAKGLLAESQRLMKEAQELDPNITSTATTSQPVLNEQVSIAPKKAGRPKKVKAVAV